jgi:excisionase family DNA binding protein
MNYLRDGMSDEHELKRAYMTTPQASKYSGLSRVYLTQLLKKGSLEGFRLGRDWLIYTDSLDRFLATPHKPGPKGPRKKAPQEQSNSSSNDGLNGHIEDTPTL